jgi:hypothetical protein
VSVSSRYRRLCSALPVGLACVPFVLPTSAAAQRIITHTCDTPTTTDSCEHWYTGASVSLQWTWSPMGTLVSGCENRSIRAEGREQRSCIVEWPGGTTVTEPVWIGIDRTPPALVGLQSDRPPGLNGWFNSPVGLTFQGSDQTSGVASCSSTTYSGPDGSGRLVSGSCRDVAGNVASGSLPINYDATPPDRPLVEAIPGNKRVSLNWRSSPEVEAVVERRTKGGAAKVVYRGPGNKFIDKRLRNKRRYRYVVRLIDQAGNRAVGKATAMPSVSGLLLPAHGARLAGPPELVWQPIPKTRYYNVQLARRGKVLSRWPRVARLQLRRSWSFDGRRYRLSPGHYCWYVWPGLGAPAERRYGPLLGRNCFTIVSE